METQQTITTYDKEHIAKKNSVMFFFDGVLFQAGLSFVDGVSVMSVLIFLLTGSASMSGLVQVFLMLGITGGKIITGANMSSVKNIPKYMSSRIVFSRIFLLVPAGFMFLNISHYFLSIIIISFYLLSFFVQGMTASPWQDIYSRTMTVRYRSTVMGYRQAFGALLSVLTSIIVQRILAHGAWDFRVQYAIIITLGAIVMAMCAIPLAGLKEVERPKTDQHNNEGLLKLIKRAKGIFKQQKHFSNYLLIRMFDMMILTAITFIIIAAKDLLDMTPAQTGILVVMRTVGNTLGGFSAGWIARKFGNKVIITIRVLLLTVIAMCGIGISTISEVPVYFAYIFAILGGIADSTMLGYMLYMMYSVSDAARPDCITLDSLILLPFSFTFYLAGLMIDLAGYLPFFILIAVLCIVTFVLVYKKMLTKKEFDVIAGE